MSRRRGVLAGVVVLATLGVVPPSAVSAATGNEFARAQIRVTAGGRATVVSGSVSSTIGGDDSHVTVARVSTGRYVVRLNGIDGGRGSVVHLVQWGAETGSPPPLCQPEEWSPAAGAVEVRVACRDSETGLFRDGVRFDIYFARHVHNPVPPNAVSHAIAGDGSRVTPYSAGGSTWQASASATQVRRTDRGVYELTFAEPLRRSMPIVTAYGSRPRWCQPSSIRTVGATRRLVVRCFRPGGMPADAEFVASLTVGDPLVGSDVQARVRIDMPGGTLGFSENTTFDGVNENVSFGAGVQQVRLDGTAHDKPWVVLAQAMSSRPRRCVVVQSTHAAAGFDPTIGFVITRCVSGVTGASVDTTQWVAR